MEGEETLKRFIVFLVRFRLGLRKYERFKFCNQKTDNWYWFDSCGVCKMENGRSCSSNVSLNWLLDKQCEVVKI